MRTALTVSASDAVSSNGEAAAATWPAVEGLLLFLQRLLLTRMQRQPRHQVCSWSWLLSCQLTLQVVLPGTSSTLQQLVVLLWWQQLPGLVRGVRPSERVELDTGQDLQRGNNSNSIAVQSDWTLGKDWNERCKLSKSWRH